MLNSPKVTAVDYNGNLLNMAVFKVLCLIGFFLLSSGYARKRKVKDHLHHKSSGFDGLKHIFRRRHYVQRFSRPASKRSERIQESSSAMWYENNTEPLIYNGKHPKGKKTPFKVFLHLGRDGFDLPRLGFLRVLRPRTGNSEFELDNEVRPRRGILLQGTGDSRLRRCLSLCGRKFKLSSAHCHLQY